ncbi:MAG: hypothetical protein K0R38_6029 [Polyangiaceae bacterium]|jgi:hypothetical protein|nr:hypothetical protein [Polyangiaceae bacterium]
MKPMASPRERKSAPLLFATIATAGLLSGCQADITGVADPGGSAPPTTTPGGSAGSKDDVPEPSDWFAAVEQADCSSAGELSRTRIRRLSTAQWNNTVTHALGSAPTGPRFPDDVVSSSTGFNTDADLNKVNVLLANAYFDGGESLAATVAPAVVQAHACLSANARDVTCAAAVVRDYGARLFRRPVTEEEASRYGGFLTAQAALDPVETAVASLLRVMLLSPSMVYMTELGTSQAGEVALTPYEQASLISYTVADLPPDSALLGAVQNGRLDDATERASHAQRLLQAPSARAKYADFWDQYLPLGDLRGASGVDAALVTAVEDETAQFFDKVVWVQNGSFRDLMTAPYTYGAPALSSVYGALTPGQNGASTLPAGQRSGFLTQAAFLFLPEDASVPHKVVHRGLVVRSRMLCQKPPPPPANLMPNAADLEPLGADATPRESFAAFQASKPACAACHNSFHPIGLAFEQFDNMGRFRTTYESGRVVETAGELVSAGDASGPYRDAVEIAQRIGQSKIGELCFTKQYAEFALGRRLNASADACVIRAPSDAQAQTPVQKLAVVLSDIEARTHRLHH